MTDFVRCCGCNSAEYDDSVFCEDCAFSRTSTVVSSAKMDGFMRGAAVAFGLIGMAEAINARYALCDHCEGYEFTFCRCHNP